MTITSNSDDETMSKKDFKVAKAEYKEARKAAGKTRKPLVIGILIAVIVVASLSSAATWFVMSQQSSPTQSAVVSQDSGDGDTATPFSEYLGVWEGDLESTTGVYNARCYGAEASKMRLEIQSISQSGHFKASIDIIYHGHTSLTQVNDVDSADGDEKVVLDDLVGTFNQDGLNLEKDITRNGNKIVFTITPSNYNGKDEIEVQAASFFEGNKVETDTYILFKNN